MDNVIAAMEARHPNLTTQKSFYVEISRARDRGELVTDDAAALKEQLEAVTGERISALEGIGEAARLAAEREGWAAERAAGPREEGSIEPSAEKESGVEPLPARALEPEPPAVEMDRELGLEL